MSDVLWPPFVYHSNSLWTMKSMLNPGQSPPICHLLLGQLADPG